MTLNWDASKIKYFNENPDELWVESQEFGEKYQDLNAITKSLVFSSMAVGLTSISEKNQAEWYARWKTLEKIDGLYLYSVFEDGEIVDKPLTPEILKKHINLSTNVGNTPIKDWAERLVRYKKNKYTASDIKAMVKFFTLEYKEITDGE